MRLSITGNIIFAEDFWDCDCDNQYIHRKSLLPVCPICKAFHEENPDARLWEIVQESPELLTLDEYAEAIKWLAIKLNDAKLKQIDKMQGLIHQAMKEALINVYDGEVKEGEWVKEVCEKIAGLAEEFIHIPKEDVYPSIRK